MDLSLPQIHKLASLARLAITEAEAESLRHDLNTMLDYVAQLDALDTSHVSPTTHPIPLTMTLRDDAPAQTLSHAQITQNAPALQDGMFVVPRVIG